MPSRPLASRRRPPSRRCLCGRLIAIGGPWTNHVRVCVAAQDALAERLANALLDDLTGR